MLSVIKVKVNLCNYMYFDYVVGRVLQVSPESGSVATTDFSIQIKYKLEMIRDM